MTTVKVVVEESKSNFEKEINQVIEAKEGLEAFSYKVKDIKCSVSLDKDDQLVYSALIIFEE